jgi:hypothetical protein
MGERFGMFTFWDRFSLLSHKLQTTKLRLLEGKGEKEERIVCKISK